MSGFSEKQINGGDSRPNLGHKHDRVLPHVGGVELFKALDDRRPDDLRIKQWTCFAGHKLLNQKVAVELCITKCSTTGPSASAGRNVRAPTRMTVPISRRANVGPPTGKLPA